MTDATADAVRKAVAYLNDIVRSAAEQGLAVDFSIKQYNVGGMKYNKLRELKIMREV